MFLGREIELNKLNERYNDDRFEMVVIYGRRRVGKTSIINEFTRDKKSIFYVATEQNNQGALRDFSRKIFELYPSAKKYMDSFNDWEDAFNYIVDEAKGERVIIAIDEYPYIAASYPAISSILQNIIDHKMKESNIFLVLCGSSMSFMENQVLGYKSPLYGRRTSQFKINPFDYLDSGRFFEKSSNYDKFIAYAVTSGIPQYLRIIGRFDTILKGIERSFFSSDGYMYEEPSNLLKQELREPAIYNSIIEAIAKGASRLNQIATKSGEDSRKCSKYLKSLIDIGIVTKETPLGMKEGRNTIYRLTDNMFKFWYRYIPNNRTLIESEMGEIVLKEKVMPEISNYLGSIFEIVCIQYLLRRLKKLDLPFVFSHIGRWWGNNSKLKRQEEIDILAYSEDQAIICECKWRNEKSGINVLNDLIRKSEQCLDYSTRYYMLFSKSGFTKELIARAENSNDVQLVTFDEIYNIEHIV